MKDSADPNDVIARLRQRKGSGPGPRPAPGPSGPGPPPPGPPPGNSQHPTIALRVGQTERIVNQLEDLLIASDRGLYQRGGVIVSTGFTKMKTWDKKDVIVQVIEERGNYAMLEDMQAVANFLGFDKKGNLRPVNPPMALAHTLKDRKSRLRFPIITGIVNCPSIEVDGTLLDQPGYDEATGVLFDPLGVKFPRVPDFPSKAMAETALKRILRVIETFAFNTQSDKAVMLSGILTGVARRGLPFAPMHAFDAPVAGSGKSKLVDIICIIATGRRAGVMSQGEKPEEFAKALDAILMRGDPLIAIDNCSHPVESDKLNMALTQEFVEVRVLGLSRMVTVQTKAFVTLTGNNLIIIGDLTRRTIKSRLDPNCERPELSQFEFDPIAYAMENRAQLVTDALTILRAYALVGRSETPPPPRLQNFELWSDTVRAALLWLGQGDPVATMDDLRQSDASIENMAAVFSAWHDEFMDNRVSADEVIEKAEAHYFVETEPRSVLGTTTSKPIRERQYTYPRLRNALMAVAKKNGQLDATTLKYWLRGVKERVITIGEKEHQLLVRLTTDGLKHGSVAAWKLEIVNAASPKMQPRTA
jgi:putative DNA primase/helicase